MKRYSILVTFCLLFGFGIAQVKEERMIGTQMSPSTSAFKTMPGGCPPSASSIGCNATSSFNVTTGFVGNAPTTGGTGCNPCCYAGSDLDCDGSQDVSFSVENSEWYQYCNSTSAAITVTMSVDEPGSGSTCNLQGACWVGNGLNSTTIDCGNASYQQFGSNVGGAADGFVFNVTVPAGQCAYFMIDGYGGSTCSSASISIICPVLPIELVEFRGVNYGIENKLSWATLSEKSNDFFVLEKSIDGVTFDPIATIEGSGDSYKKLNYSFTDKFLKHTLNYYRLKQVDFDRAYSYSDIIVVNNNNLKDQQPVKYTNIMGQEVSEDYSGSKLIFYPDGTVIKKIGL
jgi:hypothetical protein